MKKIKLVIIVISVLIVIIMAVMLKIMSDVKVQEQIKEEEEVIINKEINILKNRNIFYTISSCIDKYTNFISKNDTKALIDILDTKYIKDNNITTNNVINYIDKFKTKQINVVRKIYEQEIDKYNSLYYVYYTARNDTDSQIEDGYFGEIKREEEQDKYIIVKLDFSNETFSIMPYNGEMFR